MPVQRTEIGLVSADDVIVDFYREVFGLTALEPRRLPNGTVHRLGLDEAILKIMVPNDAPRPTSPADNFWSETGIRYFALWVDDLDNVHSRATARQAEVTLPPFELRPGVRTMVVRDPDGNSIEVMEQSS